MTALARFLRDLFWGPPQARATDEQMAAMHIYSTSARRVRAVPTRRPVKNRRTA